MKMRFAAFVAALLLGATQVSANTIRLDGFTSPVQTVKLSASPVANTPTWVGATGFKLTDLSGSMGSFVGFCVDVGHWLMRVGASQNYDPTSTPFTNSYAISSVAKGRLQSVFDANYGSLNLSNGIQAAAFQMALWEAAFEGSANATNVTNGLFRASGNGTTALANTFLLNGANYTGKKQWNLTFLQVSGLGANRPTTSGQNLVTASPVPLPAAGLLLLTAFAGAGAVSRRRKA